MAKISVLVVLLLLAVATESSIVRSPVAAAAAVTTDYDEEARAIRVKGLERIREIFGGLPDRLEKILDKLFPPKDGEERSAAGPSGAVGVVKTGNNKFSALAIDVTSAITWTSHCGGGGQRRVRCGDPICKQYGGGQNSSCGGGGGAAQDCVAGKDALVRGNFSMSSTLAGERVVFSGGEDTVYACSHGGENSGGGGGGVEYAIVGLGRGSVLANSSRKFSYLISNDLRRSFVWLGGDAAAAQGSRKSTTTTTNLISSPEMDPSLYYVSITGINVGDGKVTAGKDAATAILTTTMPFTFLNPSLFDDLNQKLRATTAAAAASEGSSSDFDGQLCYPKGTKLPAITLTFAGKGKDSEMKLQAEHYSYEKSNGGGVCLSILRSPLRGGVSVIGSMLQAGRRMTYDLGDDTLRFDFEAASSSSKPSTSSSSPPSRSSSAAAKAAVTPVLLISSALMPLLLAKIM